MKETVSMEIIIAMAEVLLDGTDKDIEFFKNFYIENGFEIVE